MILGQPDRDGSRPTLALVTERRILAYPQRPLAVRPPDPRASVVAARVDAMIRSRRPDLEVVHIGSSAVPDLPGKGVVDLGIHPASRADVPAIEQLLLELGFARMRGPAAFPNSRPLLIGGLVEDGEALPINLHVIPDPGEWARQLTFRDELRRDPDLRARYTALKHQLVEVAPSSLQYSLSKTAFIRGVLEEAGAAEPSVPSGGTIGILGGGQLGRMLALAARPLGYRIAILDPDPNCPAAALADEQIVAAYDDTAAAARLASLSDVVTYELEHVSLGAARAVDELRPIRPSAFALAMTQDRIAERRFLEGLGIPVAPWREVRSLAALVAGVETLGTPLRLKVAIGGYDGRRQVRITGATTAERNASVQAAWAALASAALADGLVLEREVAFRDEVSVVVVTDLGGRQAAFPAARNVHDEGILIESVAPAPGPRTIGTAATAIAKRIATALDAVGVVTVEMFAMPDGSLLVNELAPRVHNSGHLTIEACRTSQFEQHVRAICGLPLGSMAPTAAGAAMVNLLGTGRDRPARLLGLEQAMRDPGVSVHVYGKRRVFERRKMGHVTVVSERLGDAMDRARAAAAHLTWAD